MKYIALCKWIMIGVVICVLFTYGRLEGQEEIIIKVDQPKITYEELLAMEQHARSDPVTLLEKYHELTQIGHEYYKLGDYGKSLSLFNEVYRSAGASDTSRIDSARMVGQINLFVKNDPSKAEVAYNEMLKMTELSKEKNVIISKGHLLGEGYEKLAIAYQSQQKFDKSTSARKEMLSKGKLSPNRMSIGILENARDYLRAKNYSESLASYNLLEKQYPEYGRDDGRIVDIQLERVEAYGLDRNDPKRIELLSSIWQDERNSKYPQILNVGREIIGLADFLSKGDVVIAVANEWLRRYEHDFSTLSPEIKKRLNVDTAYGQVVITLATWLEQKGNYVLSIALYEQFLKSFPNSVFSEYARKTLDRLYQDKLLYSPDEHVKNIDSFDMQAQSSLKTPLNPITHQVKTKREQQKGVMQKPEFSLTKADQEYGNSKLWIAISVIGGVFVAIFIVMIIRRRFINHGKKREA